MTEIRVRFPPSPTGYLHIGGARTALYNWLFARRNGGKLVLRIEDTDEERSTEASAKGILEGLEWMGLDWDEGPYYQSAFADDHRAAAKRLLDEGHAYRCYCTKEELAERREAAIARKQDFIGYDGRCRDLTAQEQAAFEAEGRPSVIRFRAPQGEGSVTFDDLVFGRNEVSFREIDDFVIVRSTGVPLYVLSNAADDHRDRITHVLRGADHLINTPKQVLLYQALGWPVPVFAHMPLTLDPQKAKISKRKHGEVVSVGFYRDAGFLPWAFCNFMCLLGWSTGEDREIYLHPEELIEVFDPSGITRRNSVFNYTPGDPKFITDPKALHVNAEHLRQLPVAELSAHVQRQLEKEGLWRPEWAEGGEAREWFLTTLELIRVRYHLLTDFTTRGRAFFTDDFEVEPKAAKNLSKDPLLAELLPALADRLQALDPFDLATTEEALRALCAERGVKDGLLINAARAATSGQAVGPGIFELFVALGRDRTAARLRRAHPSAA
ncbi:MAG: glutamate--tRNA ligase [Polyangia bacterium]|jgi:glutamyl-tRNA synthetase|nr:glutamate--tRNA ligase [Polyangia bacterium]